MYNAQAHAHTLSVTLSSPVSHTARARGNRAIPPCSNTARARGLSTLLPPHPHNENTYSQLGIPCSHYVHTPFTVYLQQNNVITS
jgi:hypothetical protein